MQIRLPSKFTTLATAIFSLVVGVAEAQEPAPQAWRVIGNAGTNPATDFLGTKDDQPLAIRTNGAERLRVDTSGNVGIGTTNPTVKLDVARNGAIRLGNAYVSSGEDPQYAYANFASNAWYNGQGGVVSQIPDSTRKSGLLEFANDELYIYQTQTAGKSDWARRFTIASGGNVGIETDGPSYHTLQVGGGYDGNLGLDGSDGTPNAGYVRFGDNTGWKLHFTRQRETGGGAPLNTGTTGALVTIQDNGNVGIGTTNPQAPLDVTGMVRTAVLQITGGGDLAESFEASGVVKPGMVVAIDSGRPGCLRIADKAYDRTVAGVVSGANGLNPGPTMKQQGAAADGSLPVALTGRVYSWANTSNGPISPGDLLTSSAAPGQAMKVTDYQKAQGAIIGKAMTNLERGEGLVLVLVTLQ
jgi:hypothetical protein